ncbi:MAG: hypothetical protein GXY55_05565 [Phycisphaerae bacterium]|nr:hypothetical protein [Phycisphaerae bacterium]
MSTHHGATVQEVAFTSQRLAEFFSLEGLVVREDLQQDKRQALLAVTRMFDDFAVPYVVTGGVALQLYSTEIRFTVDLDFISVRKDFKVIVDAQAWERYGLELVFDRRRFIKLRHAASNVEIDINLDTRFLSLMEAPVAERVEGRTIRFVSMSGLAVAKLRTQRGDWPRNPEKRLQDRVDLIRVLKAHPEIAETIKAHPLTNDEMRQILDDVLAQLAAPSSDELPPEEGAEDED